MGVVAKLDQADADRLIWRSLTAFDILPYDRERGYTLIDSMRQIASARNASPARLQSRGC
jgi:hypothetical protein